VKNWDEPSLFRQTPQNGGVWSGVQFTFDPVEECDALLFLNEVRKDLTVKCPPGNVWSLIQEPFVPGVFDWVVEGHKQFARVYTHHPVNRSVRYVESAPLVPWHVNRDFDWLCEASVPIKTKDLSWVTSNKTSFPGHLKRMELLNHLKRNNNIQPEVFGRGIRFLADKWDGLAPYRYSIAVENSCGPDYWTEKLADCFLSWTLPFYYGCQNLEKYFPPEAFIRIDIENTEQTLHVIQNSFEFEEFSRRFPAIKEARHRLLHEHQFFPYMAGKILNTVKMPKETLRIHRYHKSLRTRIFNKLRKLSA
jgi:hypothetical protein